VGTFAITGCTPLVGLNYCVGAVNCTGAASTIWATGTPSIAANNLVLCADNLPANFGLFIAGPTPAMIPFFSGFLCINPVGLQRFAMPHFAGPNGNVCEQVNYAMAALGGLSVMPGMTHNYQYWYRDSLLPSCICIPGVCTANLSDALMVFHIL
jgi:hypothetical protein